MFAVLIRAAPKSLLKRGFSRVTIKVSELKLGCIVFYKENAFAITEYIQWQLSNFLWTASYGKHVSLLVVAFYPRKWKIAFSRDGSKISVFPGVEK